jgi:hypothetical protein
MMGRCILGLCSPHQIHSSFPSPREKLTHLSHRPHSHALTALSKIHLSPHSKTSTQARINRCGKVSRRLGCHLSVQCLKPLGTRDELVETEAYEFRSHNRCICAPSPEGRPAITRERREGGSTKRSRVERVL